MSDERVSRWPREAYSAPKPKGLPQEKASSPELLRSKNEYLTGGEKVQVQQS